MLSYKIFVRQSDNNPGKLIEKLRDQLNFRGDEAKKVYDEIIQEDTKETSGNSSKKPFKPVLNSKIRARRSKKRETQKITANLVLRAIEQVDWDFLIKNVDKDNVDIVDDYGWTPLMSASYSGNTEIVKFLLNSGADRKIKEKTGLDALKLAEKRRHKEIISLLKSKELKKEKHPEEVELDLEEFYCSICNQNFKETNLKKHEASMLHIFNTNPRLPDPIYGISKQNKGYQIMLNTGWEEAKGLGPSGSGQKYPVKTVLKRDRKGFGRDTDCPRVTHFKSNDVDAIRHIKQRQTVPYRKRDREKFLSKEARRERALRRALS